MPKISDEELEKKFDAGEDMTPYMDMDTLRRPNQERLARRISVDIPEGILFELDTIAARVGVPRQTLIKVWLFERLQVEMERGQARNEKSLVPKVSLDL